MKLIGIEARARMFRAQALKFAEDARMLHRQADDYARLRRGRGGYNAARRRANACGCAAKEAADEANRLLSQVDIVSK